MPEPSAKPEEDVEPPANGHGVKLPEVAPKPHPYTFLVSVVAISISVISALLSAAGWYENHENRRLNEAATAAHVYIASVKVTRDDLGAGDDPEHQPLWGSSGLSLTLRNSGKVGAADITGKVSWAFVEDSHKAVVCAQSENVDYSMIDPGSEAKAQMSVIFSKRAAQLADILKDQGSSTFIITADISFADVASHSRTNVKRVFCAPGFMASSPLDAAVVGEEIPLCNEASIKRYLPLSGADCSEDAFIR